VSISAITTNLSTNWRGLQQKNSKQQVTSNNIAAIRPNSDKLVDTNYGQSFVKHSNISFKGELPAVPVELTRKISSVIPFMKFDDVIVIGNDLKKTKEMLKDSISAFSNVIKKMFFIQQEGAKQSVALRKNSFGSFELLNLDKNPVFVVSDKGEQFFVKPHELLKSVHDNDNVFLSGSSFKISYDLTDIKNIRANYVKAFDFSDYNQSAIDRINLNYLNKLDFGDGEEAEAAKKLTFANVGGQDHAISELKKSIIYPIKFPEAFRNSILNRGTILTGGPGTGKSLIAEALANEVDAHYIKLNGLEMESKFVGQSEENWRQLFEEAKENQPCVMFIDEFDAVARNRTGAETGRYDSKVVNQLLTLMSDLEKGKDDVFVIAATNKLELLDPAILRSGRFGKHIPVNKPDLAGCKQIFDIHTKGIALSESVNADAVAARFYDAKMSGADIAFVVNEANQKAFERSGIFEKMEKGTFKEIDIKKLKIEQEDIDKVLDEYTKQNKIVERNPIGYEKKYLG